MMDRNTENLRMIETQLKRRGIKDSRVLETFERIQRHQFVPAQHQSEAYGDFPLAIGAGQTISQPFVIALMLEFLHVSPEHEVLEVGTGSGYSTALLASLVKWVDSLEFYRDLLIQAQKRLAGLPLNNYRLWHCNGWNGPPTDKTYDRIVVWACPNRIPEALLNALKAGGKMVIPVGKFDQRLLIVTLKNGQVKRECVDWVRFVPLINGDPL